MVCDKESNSSRLVSPPNKICVNTPSSRNNSNQD